MSNAKQCDPQLKWDGKWKLWKFRFGEETEVKIINFLKSKISAAKWEFLELNSLMLNGLE